MEEINKWIDEEYKALETEEYQPYLKLEQNKMVNIKINFDKKFEKRPELNEKGEVIKMKALIPVVHKTEDGHEESRVWWLNVKNPIYREILERGKKGQRTYKIFVTKFGTGSKFTILDGD